jgi:hypothetical protein
MKRIRIIGVCLVAVFALGAVAVSSASAANLFQVNGSMTFGSRVISPAPITITGGKLAGDGIEITCPSLTILGGLIDEVGNLVDVNTSVTFTSCVELVKETKCKLSSSTISTVPLTGILHSATEIEVTPKSGTEFVTITVENVPGKECTLDGTYTVTGDGILAVSTASTEEVEHTLTLSANSKLKINTNPATIEGSGKGKLETGEKWSIVS